MKIIILSDANSIHTARWAKSLSEEGIHIIVFSLFSQTNRMKSFYKKIKSKLCQQRLKDMAYQNIRIFSSSLYIC